MPETVSPAPVPLPSRGVGFLTAVQPVQGPVPSPRGGGAAPSPPQAWAGPGCGKESSTVFTSQGAGDGLLSPQASPWSVRGAPVSPTHKTGGQVTSEVVARPLGVPLDSQASP